MIRRITVPLALAVSGVLASISMAQTPKMAAMQHKTGMARARTHVTTRHRGVTKLYGAVKGNPTGTMFTLAVPRKGDYMVDAASAKFRLRGRFTSASNLKRGEFAHVTGSLRGMNVRATDVDITSMPGAHKSGRMSAHRTMKMRPMPRK